MEATPRAVVLVEGESDRAALEALAARAGRDLAADGVAIVPMGGVTNIRTFASHYGPLGLDLPLAGLYDAPEEALVRRGLIAAGFPAAHEPGALHDLGFHQCTSDLEDELIRALGTTTVEDVIAAEGETRSLQLLASMPAQRAWTRDAVLHRFLGSQAGRKARYAALLADALAPDDVPAPLTAVLTRV